MLNNHLQSPLKQLRPNNFVEDPLTERNNGSPSESEEEEEEEKKIISDSFDSEIMVNLRINTNNTKDMKIKMINQKKFQ